MSTSHSRVVLGTMIISAERQSEANDLLDAAVAAGISALDTAHVYGGGQSERGIGQWMEARGNRQSMTIISKGCHHNVDRARVTPFDIGADLHDSLARLKTDYLDVWMLHRDDTSVPVGPIVETLNGYLAEGKIRAFGGSNWSYQRMAAANAYAAEHGLVPFTVSSPNYGLAIQVNNPWGPGCETLTGPSQAVARQWHVDNSMTVYAYSSLARGLFSGRMTRETYQDVADAACQTAYCHEVNFGRLDRAQELAGEKGVTVTQIALAYALSGPLQANALVGATNAAECASCVAAQSIELSDDELAYLEGNQ